MYSTDRWTPRDWLLPARESGDLLEVAARVQIASEQGFRFGNPYGKIDRLGQPDEADWSLYPTPDRPTFFIAGQLARFTGALSAVNLMAWLGCLLNAAGFVFAARLLRWSTPWRLTGAILFAFCTHNFRWGDTLSLSYTFGWPTTLVLLHWLSRSAPLTPSLNRWRYLAVACGTVLGLGNPYFTFIAGQLGGWVLIRQWLQPANPRRHITILFLVSIGLSFVISQAGYFHARLQPTEIEQLQRNLGGTEFYALRPIEMLLPPANHWSTTLARIGLPYRSHSMFRSNESTIYLGLIALVGLAGLFGATIRVIARSRRCLHRKLPEAALTVGWIFVFSAVGGLNTLLGLFHFDLFRATNRYSFVLLLVGLFWALNWVRRRSATSPQVKIFAATALMIFGLWDQLPPPTHTRLREELRGRLEDNIQIATTVAEALPSGAKVYQLPAVPFPEAGHQHRFPDYEHFRLFLHAPELQLSYGGLRGSYSETLGRWLGQLPADQLPAALEAGGFNAVTLDRRAYLDNGTELIRAFEDAGKAPLLLPVPSTLVAFHLNPEQIFRLPAPADPRFLQRWDPRLPLDSQWPPESSTSLALYLEDDWYGSEHYGEEHWRWAKKSSSSVLFFSSANPSTSIDLQMKLACFRASAATLQWRGETVWSGQCAETPIEISLRNLPFKSGATQKLTVQFTEPFVKTRLDSRPLGFRIIDLKAALPD